MPLYHYLCTPRRTFSPLQCRISYFCRAKKSASPYLRPREQKNVDIASFRASIGQASSGSLTLPNFPPPLLDGVVAYRYLHHLVAPYDGPPP